MSQLTEEAQFYEKYISSMLFLINKANNFKSYKLMQCLFIIYTVFLFNPLYSQAESICATLLLKYTNSFITEFFLQLQFNFVTRR